MNHDLRLSVLKTCYAKGQTTPRELILGLRERAAQLNAEYRLFIHLLSAEELESYFAKLEAKDPDQLPLYGVPFAIKDNIDLAGIPTTAACPAFAYIPNRSATVVQRLIDLGAVPLGKTNLDQFATGLNGTRSPYGACRNSVHPDYPSGGSSAGSPLAVALGLASFALGTDTAGSGRVPAALNGLVGLKPSKGLLSTAGVVPACRTLDCVTTFTYDAAEASELLALLAHTDSVDEYSRANPGWNAATAFGDIASFRFGVPAPEYLEFFGCPEGPALFQNAIDRLKELGGEPVTINLAPFLEAARLLYEGPWIAERYNVVGELAKQQPEAVLPVIHAVLSKAPDLSAVDTFRSQYRLQALKAECDRIMEQMDCVLTPTIGRPVTLSELYEDPVLRNAELGYYTNFMNLLDYSAVAVPSGRMANDLPWGVTLFGRAFTDQYLLSLAHAYQAGHVLGRSARNDRARIVVCGAHLAGLPLNWQLIQRGGRLMKTTRSSARYRLFALAGGPVKRPGMVRVKVGVAIEVEVWEIASAELGSFLDGIPAPLGLGKVELADGRWETGFICESSGLEGALDISAWGGWRAWLQSLD